MMNKRNPTRFSYSTGMSRIFSGSTEFGDAAITSAIVDRLTYKAYLIDMEGDSYRLRETLRSNGSDFETVTK